MNFYNYNGLWLTSKQNDPYDFPKPYNQSFLMIVILLFLKHVLQILKV